MKKNLTVKDKKLLGHPTLDNGVGTFEQRMIKVDRKTEYISFVFSNSLTLFGAGNYSWFCATEVSC